MQSVQVALVSLGLDKQVTVTTTHSLAVLETSYPSSAGAFHGDLLYCLSDTLSFHQKSEGRSEKRSRRVLIHGGRSINGEFQTLGKVVAENSGVWMRGVQVRRNLSDVHEWNVGEVIFEHGRDRSRSIKGRR